MIDESVRCLQEYLNANGYELTSEGPGSPGNETDKYGALTREAVAKWQEKNGVSPAIGIFGPVSQAKYKELVSTSVAAPAEQSEADRLLSMVGELQAQLNARLAGADPQSILPATVTTPIPQVAGAQTDEGNAARLDAEDAIRAVMEMIADASDQLDDA